MQGSSPLALPLCLAKVEKTPCFEAHKRPAKEKLLGSARLCSAAFSSVTVGAGEMVSHARTGGGPHMGCASGVCEAGSAGGSSSLDTSTGEEKAALVISTSEIQPGIRKREDFPNRCTNRGVQYVRVQLNAMNQIGLGRIYRRPVWKSGLFRFLAAVSQQYAVSQHALASYVHVGVLGLKGSVSSWELLGWA